MVVNPGVTYVSSKADALLLEKLKEGLGADPAAVAFDVRLGEASFFNPNNVRRVKCAACADCGTASARRYTEGVQQHWSDHVVTLFFLSLHGPQEFPVKHSHLALTGKARSTPASGHAIITYHVVAS